MAALSEPSGPLPTPPDEPEPVCPPVPVEPPPCPPPCPPPGPLPLAFWPAGPPDEPAAPAGPAALPPVAFAGPIPTPNRGGGGDPWGDWWPSLRRAAPTAERRIASPPDFPDRRGSGKWRRPPGSEPRRRHIRRSPVPRGRACRASEASLAPAPCRLGDGCERGPQLRLQRIQRDRVAVRGQGGHVLAASRQQVAEQRPSRPVPRLEGNRALEIRQRRGESVQPREAAERSTSAWTESGSYSSALVASVIAAPGSSRASDACADDCAASDRIRGKIATAAPRSPPQRSPPPARRAPGASPASGCSTTAGIARRPPPARSR